MIVRRSARRRRTSRSVAVLRRCPACSDPDEWRHLEGGGRVNYHHNGQRLREVRRDRVTKVAFIGAHGAPHMAQPRTNPKVCGKCGVGITPSRVAGLWNHDDHKAALRWDREHPAR